MKRFADAFRFTTLALALAPFLPIVGYEQTDGSFTVLSWVQVTRLHLEHSAANHPGMFVLLLPSVLALVSLAVPTARARARQALAVTSLVVGFIELVLVTSSPGLAQWFGIDALIPASRFGRHAWMMVFLTVLWTWLEIRPEIEEQR